MRQDAGIVRRRVGDLEQGDETVDYGPVTHREGRKVWFEARIVTFTSLDDEVAIMAGEE